MGARHVGKSGLTTCVSGLATLARVDARSQTHVQGTTNYYPPLKSTIFDARFLGGMSPNLTQLREESGIERGGFERVGGRASL